MTNLAGLSAEARKQYNTLSENDKKQFEQFNEDELLKFTKLSERMDESSRKLYEDYILYFKERADQIMEPMTFEEYDSLCIENRSIAHDEIRQMFSFEAQFSRTKRILDETVRDALLSEDLKDKNKELIRKYSRNPFSRPKDKDKEIER